MNMEDNRIFIKFFFFSTGWFNSFFANLIESRRFFNKKIINNNMIELIGKSANIKNNARI